MSRNAPDSWKQHYFKRIKQLVDNYQPDLLYTDGGIPFEEYGLGLVADLYNVSAKRHGGKRGGHLHQQDAAGLPDGHVRAGPGARRGIGHSGRAVADGHLHRRLALQQGDSSEQV